jgi:hypothetical protein
MPSEAVTFSLGQVAAICGLIVLHLFGAFAAFASTTSDGPDGCAQGCGAMLVIIGVEALLLFLWFTVLGVSR